MLFGNVIWSPASAALRRAEGRDSPFGRRAGRALVFAADRNPRSAVPGAARRLMGDTDTLFVFWEMDERHSSGGRSPLPSIVFPDLFSLFFHPLAPLLRCWSLAGCGCAQSVLWRHTMASAVSTVSVRTHRGTHRAGGRVGGLLKVHAHTALWAKRALKVLSGIPDLLCCCVVVGLAVLRAAKGRLIGPWVCSPVMQAGSHNYCEVFLSTNLCIRFFVRGNAQLCALNCMKSCVNAHEFVHFLNACTVLCRAMHEKLHRHLSQARRPREAAQVAQALKDN